MKEIDLAKKVIAWLRDFHWEIYQEVQVFSFGDIADIVAVQNGICWIIECKTTLSLDVIAQAHRWRFFSNYVSVATPKVRSSKGRDFATVVMRQFGIGYLSVGQGPMMSSTTYVEVSEQVAPALYRNPHNHLKDALRDEHKTWAEAGNDKGARYSPFQDTCNQVRRAVHSRPGVTMKEIISSIDHHYSTPGSARSCMLKWAEEGMVKGVRVVRESGTIRLYPENHEAKGRTLFEKEELLS